ncbi:hypothetical protein [Mycolicibacterium celeriflavum]|uniref:Uncharacterized protein n=1 Tax=Mycolicibacterium celeriflavum TaxID=1249101 RepID=A0A1X0BJX6_MYCCF|nr:hypothetical protein [Mycolicibacterium celeriflavum]MCV7240942.1 hypothetical protein [Mycolicibacterium celeriflavum]ORA42786.1 hypothetical protein BST21_22905 [Mycolicibacterium celeriflavum]BBY44184.1 hypothetical protein MCEL_24790 [Mycolicibacterium celeriflavum]
MHVAGNAEARAQLLRNILAVLEDDAALTESLLQNDPAKIHRLDAVRPKASLALPVPWPATPLSDAALMTNARNEPTLAAELLAELASADHSGSPPTLLLEDRLFVAS